MSSPTTCTSADTQNPIQARSLARRELPNLRRALRLAIAAGALDEAVDFADSINRFLDYFGRWRERDEVAGEVERAVGRRGQESGVRSQEARDQESGAETSLVPGPQSPSREPSPCWSPAAGSGCCKPGGRGRRRVFRRLLARLEGGCGVGGAGTTAR